jgi:hypothetical protein
MPWHPALNQLRDALADIYPTEADASTLVATVEGSATPTTVRLAEIADEIISVLAGDSLATVKVTPEISADFPNGVSDHLKRAVSENAASLGFKNRTWE